MEEQEQALISLEQLAERIASGEPMESIIGSVLPAAHRLVYQRCSLVRALDQPLYDAVLGAGLDGAPSFGQIARSSDVEALPRSPGTCRLRAEARRRWFDAWWSGDASGAGGSAIPPGLRETAARLVAFYQESNSPVDELASLVFVDQERARALFRQLFDHADDEFDLAGCRDVLDAVGEPEKERNRLLEPALLADVSERARRLRVRALWADDWYRTSRFLAPAGFLEYFTRLLSKRPPRFLQIYARGGMGKTMGLRWLIARSLVPDGIAVTRLDFDFMDPLTAVSEPWLLLVEAARQLTDQLPGGPFTELTSDYGRYLPVLHRSGQGPAAPAPVFDISHVRQRAAVTVPDRFAAAINESAGTQPVVMIFDTMEEALLRTPGLEPFTAALRRLRQTCPAIRLVFSGRYEIDEKCPGFSASFPGLEPVRLKPFTDDEAREYLRDFRGIEDNDLREAAVRQAGGLPFKLALFADVLQEQPTMTVADIRAYHEPDLLYLIERVVERIPYFGVRWVLRYGALARVLSRKFLTEFLAAYVDRGVSGDPQFDEPRLDSLPRSRSGAAHLPFSTDIRDRSELDPDLLWKRLRAYAASASWVTAEDADMLRFHPDVVNPMRRILRKQPAFAILSADAARYFCALADGDPDRWGMWIREAVHHRLQLDGGEAVPFWEETMATAVRSGRHDWRRALAHEVLDREATGPDGGRMAPEDGSPLLPPEAVSLANFEVAASCVEEAQASDAGPAHPLWSDARLHFDAAVSSPAASHAIPAARRALVDAALLRRDAAAYPEERSAKLAEAENTVQAAVRRNRLRLFWLVCVYVLVGIVTLVLARRQRLLSARAGGLIDLARLNALLAEVVADQGRLESANKIIRSALAIGWRDRLADTVRPATAGAVFRAVRSVAGAEADGGRLDLAAGLLPASGWAAEDAGPAGPAELSRLAATIDLQAGQPARALERLPGSPAPPEDRRERVRNAVLQARSQLASHRPADAIGVLSPLLEDLATASPPDSNTAETDAMQAGVRETLADAFAAVGELRNASLELDTAVSLWDRAGARDRAAGAACAAAAIQLRESEDLNQAAYLVGTAESLRPEPGSRTWVTARLLRAELSVRLGEAVSSAELLNDTRGLLPVDAAPGLLITLALTGLATDTGAAVQWLDLLHAQLGRIRPAQARLGYLPGLARVPALDGFAPAGLIGRLRRTAAVEDLEQWAPGLLDRDRQVLTLAAAELERVAGHPARAAGLLGRLLAELDEAADPVLTIRACQAGSRLAGQPLPRLDDARFGRLLDALAAFPAMQGIALLEQAARTSDAQVAIALLDRAQRALTQAGGPPDARLASLLDARAARETQLGDEPHAAYSSRLADEIREQLGWRLDRSPTGPVPGRPRITVSLQLDSDRAVKVTATLPGTQVHHGFPADVPVVGRILGTDAPEGRGLADEPPAGLVASIARDWSGFGRAAGSLGFDPAWFATREPLDVVLRIPDRRLASVPWELMRAPGSELVSLDPLVAALFRGPGRPGARSAEVRVVQGALNALLGSDLPVDGIMGPASRAALAAFQRSNGLTVTGDIDSITGSAIRGSLASREPAARPLALVATLGFEHQRIAFRGESSEGSDVAYEYRSAGFAVQTLKEVTPARLREAMTRFAGPGTRPAVLHLSAGITVATGTLSLDLGDEAFYEKSYSRSGGQQVTAKWLDSLLQADTAWGPVVILDVPRPPTETEAARMLMLRNLFAADLFELGASSAVIATGLAAYDASYGRSRLLAPLGAGASLAEAVRAVRELAGSASAADGFPEELAFASTALFTQVPWMGVVAP